MRRESSIRLSGLGAETLVVQEVPYPSSQALQLILKISRATAGQASHLQVGGEQKAKEPVSLDHSLAVTDFQVRCIIPEKSNVSTRSVPNVPPLLGSLSWS